jgi:hypothetical protein
MLLMGFEPRIPVFESAKTVDTVDSAATVIEHSLLIIGIYEMLTIDSVPL